MRSEQMPCVSSFSLQRQQLLLLFVTQMVWLSRLLRLARLLLLLLWRRLL